MVESSYSVSEQLIVDQQALRLQIVSALDNAPILVASHKRAAFFSPWPTYDIAAFTLTSNGITIPLYARAIRANDVYLAAKEAHLFPWLCHEVYERIHIRGKTEQATVLHEFSHFAATLASHTIEPKIGFSFYKDGRNDKSVFVEPNVLLEGEGTIEEIRSIIMAPKSDMSKQDKRILHELNHQIRKNSRNTWPIWPTGSKYSIS